MIPRRRWRWPWCSRLALELVTIERDRLLGELAALRARMDALTERALARADLLPSGRPRAAQLADAAAAGAAAVSATTAEMRRRELADRARWEADLARAIARSEHHEQRE